MVPRFTVLLLALVSVARGQRPFFAGTRPIGYPDVGKPAGDQLENKFGEGDSNVSTTTQRLPLEANGDRDLVDRLSKLPKDQQPFWLLNWQALEANRKNPQSYPQRPNSFAQPIIPPNTNTQNVPATGSSFIPIPANPAFQNRNAAEANPTPASNTNSNRPSANAGVTQLLPVNSDATLKTNKDKPVVSPDSGLLNRFNVDESQNKSASDNQSEEYSEENKDDILPPPFKPKLLPPPFKPKKTVQVSIISDDLNIFPPTFYLREETYEELKKGKVDLDKVLTDAYRE